MNITPYDENLATCTRCDARLSLFEVGKENHKNDLICRSCYELLIDAGNHKECDGCNDALAKGKKDFCQRCERDLGELYI